MYRINYRGYRAEIQMPLEWPQDLNPTLNEIPSNHWQYFPHQLELWVWEPYVGSVVRALKAANAPVEFSGQPYDASVEAVDAPESVPDVDPDYRHLFLYSDAPTAVVRAAYRALAKLAHPDADRTLGKSAYMQRLNAAYERIMSRHGQ